MADEATIRKLENILNEKMKQIDAHNQARNKNDDAVQELRQLLDEERRKSMVDEGRVKEIQKVLNEKIKEANDYNKKISDMARKSDMNDEEVRFLKDEIDKERRKSTADENLVKKLEFLLAEKLKIIDETKNKTNSLENNLRNLASALEGERKKSLADEATLKKLEA